VGGIISLQSPEENKESRSGGDREEKRGKTEREKRTVGKVDERATGGGILNVPCVHPKAEAREKSDDAFRNN